MSDWLTVRPLSGINDYTLTVSASVNTDTTVRKNVIIARNNEYHLMTTCIVTQGFVISVDKDSLYFDAGYIDEAVAGTDTITITCGNNWVIDSCPQWLSFSQMVGSSGETTITVSAATNMDATRIGTIVLKSGTVTREIAVEQGYNTYVKYTSSTNEVITPSSGSITKNVKVGDYCYLYPSEKNIIPSYLFNGKKSITSAEIRNAKTIQIYAFNGCSNLTALTLTEGLETIGNCSFGKIGTLNELYIPSTVNGVSSGKWFENSRINKIIVAATLSGSSTWTSYDINGSWSRTGTTTIFGVGISASTVEMLSGSTAGVYSLSLNGLSSVIVHSGASYVIDYNAGIYKSKLVNKTYNNNPTTSYYSPLASTGTVTRPSGVYWPVPTGWTVIDTS